MLTFAFAGVDFFGGGVDHGKDGRADESVIDYAVGGFEEGFAFEGEESGVAGSSADKVDCSEGAKGLRVLHGYWFLGSGR